jgi:NAD-dependent SIR2 family protein deacetylase
MYKNFGNVVAKHCEPAKFECNYCGKDFYREYGHRCIYTDVATLAAKVVELEKKLAELTAEKAVI